ncbi:myosin-IIIb-like [Schistocerca cancellata]|uniref:myosin-IIIb-like n=1 Tax=Schistocerca cancellata TaxID=274614 RepID=UPI0021185B74|nr:myosin-IIIb-like [Schistocerca cancellata]XP_049784576.1 myosin-IIIb-like [Schistocerca cancellata]XP_049784577.1 myosin-IIIb-like [Schistocerca cancellata]
MAYRGLSQHVNFEQLNDPGDRFTLQELIGEGTYGVVYSARDTTTGHRVAVKILENVPDNIEEIEEEYLILKDLSLHPNIPSFNGLFLKRGSTPEEDQLWFVMELCTGGSVTDLVQGLKHRGERLSEEQIAYILHETVQALIYLHSNHCMHRDVKGHNILLTEEAHVKLVDFGVSSHLAATLARRNTSVGTPYWMAPEVIACEQQLDSSYDARCDVWSVGITAIELAEGDPPLSDLHPMRALFQIPRIPPPSLARPEEYSQQFSDFLSECLVKDLEQRPFARELLEHPLMKKGALVAEKVRRELRAEIQRQRKEGRTHRQPEVTTKHGKLKSDRKSKPQKMYMDDLAALDILTEDGIVEQLQRRYEQFQIYTYIGDILVAVNPFKDLGLYSDQEQRRYKGQARSDNPPHIFAVADAAYQALMHQRQNQAIVISGESGAGKTESANLLLKQLVYLGKAPNRNLEERILQVNPIMEAFGNAQTGINANSSRFGKYLDLTMTKSGKVTGARIAVYLLEQSRVCQHAQGERNFHIFYYMYDGLEHEGRLSEFHLDPVLRIHHKYLGGDLQDPETKKTNVSRFHQVKEGFRLLGFREEEVDTIYRIIAAVLHLGDVEFGEVISQDNTDNKSRVIDLAPLHRVSRLLGLEPSDLLESLTSNSVVTRGETITRNNTVKEAYAARDAMAKGLYGRLFDWMVNQINCLLMFNRANCGEPLAVGLLDIFGFENFPKNSFEQLCINIANEQIQYYFNQHIFTWEQQEYMAEGIPVDLVEFSDNRPVLDMLLSRPMGLLALLDEESRFPRSTDKSLIDKFHSNIKSKHYIRPKSNALCFAVQHYAGRVIYQAEGFLDKNRNFLPPEVIQLLRQSHRDMVRFLFQCPITKTGNLYSISQESPRETPVPGSKERYSSRGLASQSRAQQTVATYFRYSLMDLLQKMVSGSPQFVRCIKPNDARVPQLFDSTKVIKQLRYTGVLETIRIRQNGFSHRIPFAEFLRRYCFLAFGFDERVVASRENCRLLLVRLKMDGWALGKTKVFLKYYHVEYLSKLYEDQVRKIVLVQACVRRWLAKVKYQREKWQLAVSVVTLQRFVRGWITRRRFIEQQKQAELRRQQDAAAAAARVKKGSPTGGWFKAKLLRRMSSQQMIGDKGNESPKKELDEESAAVVIQSHFRGYTVRRRWGAEIEARVRKVLETHNTAQSAQDALEKEGLTPDDAALIIQRYYRSWRKGEPLPVQKNRQRQKQPQKVARLPDRQADLITFSQNVHMMNQEAHKYLRRNKPGVRLSEVQDPPKDYVRPKGFHLIPGIVSKGNNQRPDAKQAMPNETSSYYEALQEEMSSPSPEFGDDDATWDLPIIEVENKLRPIRHRMETLDMDQQRKELIASRGQENVFPERHVVGAWHAAMQGQNKFPDVKNNHRNNNNNNNTDNMKIRNGDHRPDKRVHGLQNGSTANENRSGAWVSRPSYINNNMKNNNYTPGNPFKQSDVHHLLRQTSQSPESPTGVSLTDPCDNEINGPYNFRQLLRPTEHAPTESLRKRKGVLGNEVMKDNIINPRVSNHLQDSPTKRRAKPVPKKL